MNRLYDIDLNDIELKSEYYNNFFYGDIETAHGIVEDNPQLSDKVINEDNLNYIVNTLIDIENLFIDGYINEMERDRVKFQISIDDLVYCSEYDSTEQYEKFNFVIYNHNLYFCLDKPPIGTSPTNTAYWLNLSLRGDSGDSSSTMGVSYKGLWVSGSYLKDDMVAYNGNLCVALDDTSTTPTDTTHWYIMEAQVIRQKLYVSRTEPVVPSSVTDVLWFQVID